MKYVSTEHRALQAENEAYVIHLVDERMAWRSKRMKANRLKRLYDLAGYKEYGERVELCARWFKFGLFGENKERHLLEAKFCGLRLCPICIARGAMVRGKLLSRVMNAVEAERECQYVFVTLTVQNVTGDKLGETIGQLCKGWDRLMKHRKVQRAWKGTFRAIEITRNNDPKSEWYGTYHAHIHAVVAVEDEYFEKDSPLFITHGDLMARWRKVLKLDYDPRVYIEATYEGKDENKRKKRRKKRRKKVMTGDDAANRGAVLEAAKYATKDSDYISDSLSDEEGAQVVTDYTRALYHRRLTSFTGWLKEMAQRLQAVDLDNVDLVQGEEATIREDLAEVIEEYGWHFGAGDYVLARRYINPLRVTRAVTQPVGQEGGGEHGAG